MFSSVQWKIASIYALLILFAMQFFVVFLTQSLEQYYLRTYARNLEAQGLLLANFLERYLTGTEESSAIDGLVLEYSRHAGITDIMVLDSFGRLVSSSRTEAGLEGQRIIQEEITRALTGSRSWEIRLNPETSERVKHLALPVRSGEKIIGVVYLSGSLEPLYATLREIQLIFLTGAVLVIGVTVLLGFFLARSITGPIQEVTAKAAQIAQGDFRQQIDVRSHDEIGRLGEMFNYLSRQLDATLLEMSSEKGKMAAILSHMTEGIVALNRDGKVVHLNPTGHRLLELSPGEEPPAALLTQLLAQVDLAALLNNGRQQSREIILPPHKRTILASYVPFHTQEQTACDFSSGVLIILHDISKERELVRIQQEFVANVSHELRTPLTTLKSYTETLLGGAMYHADTCFSFLTTMEKETERMVRLVKDLLVLSQLDFQQVAWRRLRQRLDELVLEAVNELQIEFGADRPSMVVTLPERAIYHCFDRDKMKQVLLNVIQNAFKYTGQNGKVAVVLTDMGSAITILVQDDGIGIPLEDADRVFQRFYRVDKARSRDFGGTGLGLAIAREIVEAHGGTITLTSQPEQGTEVRISLPYSQAEGGREQCASA
ncbi:MAG: HAMP domain-containing protein [Dethiobacter sp.]|jgi:two-component system sensor histidine kinase VicK|nr:HAMP domain-containing protein [Dethiobacter sp.]MBS3898258.1 HAMP domain-containing protein [Dethiobacter sp.]MBS3983833.1 HAMP domain-containing protein [Dethiobacter sp.]